MSEPSSEEQGAGRETGSLPIGIRARARRLYRNRRAQLMEVPVAVLEARFGDALSADRETHQSARVSLDAATLEIGFAGKHRMFGSLIDTQWVGVTGTLAEPIDQLDYRFDKRRFFVKKGSDGDLAARLSDSRTQGLAQAAELKALTVEEHPDGRRVTMIPLPGTITAVYFPPLPPYTVPMKAHEVEAQIDLVLHLLAR
ncbi:MAG: hypothetical protein OEW30_03350 [Acidimicrobiia bacterium]|nr:hypothetical protein [Acidimicrobiia bacterium]